MRSFASHAFPLALGLCFLLPSSAGLAQIQLPGITVQGATLEAPRALPGKGGAGEPPPVEETKDSGTDGVPAASIGNAVTVITRDDLERQQTRQIADALRSLPGVAVQRTGAYGNLTQVRIRGAEGNHTLVLIDGVEANNATDGEFDFSNLAVADIERIEVIRGAMSALYGSGAVGGVINIVTRRGRGPLTLTLRTEAGSLGTTDVAARLAAGGPWANFALSANWRKTDGFNISPFGSEDDGMDLRTFNFTGGVKLLEGIVLDVNLRHVDKTADRDFFGGLMPGTLATAVDDPSFQRDRLFMGGLRLRWDTLNNQLTHQMHFKYNRSSIFDTDLAHTVPLPPPPFVPQDPFVADNLGERTTYGYLGTYRFDTPALGGAKHTVSGLVEKERETFVAKGDFTDNETHKRDRLAVAGEWRTAFGDQVFVTAGLRHDDNSAFDDFTTWRLAAAWAIKPLGLRPHASVGTAVKFPAMFEQFGELPLFFTPNPNLKPEESLGWDVGVEFGAGPATTVDLTYFHADLKNKIAFSGLFPPEPTLINLPGVSTRDGLELALRTRFTPSLTGTFAYTYLLAEEATGLQEIRRPRHAGRADLAYVFAGGLGSATLGVLYNGSMTDFRFVNTASDVPNVGQFLFALPAGRLLLDDYWVVNAAVSYKLQPGVELFGRVENLFDERYQEAFGFEAAPIAAFAGIKLTFGGPEGVAGIGSK